MASIVDKIKAKKALAATTSAGLEPRTRVAGKLQQKLDFARSSAGKAISGAEVHRIVGLPVVLPMTDEQLEDYNKASLLATAYDSGFRLFPTQANSALEFSLRRGLFGPIGVGWGKTLITLICANIGYRDFGVRKVALLAPPSIMSQLLEHDLQWARKKVPINYPIHVLHGKSAQKRRRIAESDLPGLYIIPYSLMSARDASDILDAIKPGMMVCDEIQNIKDRKSARTKRVMRYVEEHRPLGVGLSGTITRKSVMDYHHLIRWCLGQNSPLPYSTTMAGEWAGVLDADAEGGSASNTGTGPLQPLVGWAKRLDKDGEYPETRGGFRRAYKLRMTTCPGVVASGDAEIGVSLVLENRPVKEHQEVEGWPELESLIERIETEWVTPNGDEIEYPIHTYKWLYELSAGFYNELKWPQPSALASRRDISEDEAYDILSRAEDYHIAHQEYAKRLRKFLQEESAPNLDTPMLAGANMARHGSRDVPTELYRLWKKAKDKDFEDRPERDSTAVRVCPYKINDAVSWAMALPKGEGAIIWYYHQEVGKWLMEELRAQGVDCLHCPAGDAANERIIDPTNGNKVVVASLKAHGTGKNLQHFQYQYVTQWPRPAQDAEQFLGRTHRNGQKADELVVVTNNTLAFDDMNMSACINDSLYIHQTTGSRQKLILATYNPLPKIFPSEVLLERGMQTTVLDRKQVQLLTDKFGGMQE